jgi:hypothetical protein
MNNLKYKMMAVGALSMLLTSGLLAGVPNNLAYPTTTLTDGKAVMDNVYFVNHFYAFKNYSIEKNRRIVTVIVKKSDGEKPLTDTVERYLNNDYNDDASVKAKDLAIFRSGKMKGTGMLITDYEDDARSQEYLAWLPALRKIRRFAQPAHDDAWGGTDFTFGDVTLRKPMHEKHELLGTETFGKTVHTMVIPAGEKTSTAKKLPAGTDEYKDRTVYKVKSTTKFPSWWYDYRITYVDTKNFSDYLTEYYKNGKLVKTLEKNWKPIEGQTDPRALRWYTWYAVTLDNNHQTMAYIPKAVTKYNTNLSSSLWTEKTLTKIKK